MAPHVVLRCCKNLGYLNYRVEVNEVHDYETSNRTSTLSVARRSRRRPQRRPLACNIMASHTFKRLDLNPLHLNAVLRNNQGSNNKEEEENERDALQFTVKNTPSDRRKHQYALAQQPQAQYEPFQPSLGPANDHLPNNPNPRLAVDMDQTRHMAATTQRAPSLKSLHQRVSNSSL